MAQKETAAPAGTGSGDENLEVGASKFSGISGGFQHQPGHKQTATWPGAGRAGFIPEFAARMYAMRAIRAHVLGGAA